ncbi:tetratricopeptide repeat protein [Haliscomenobacter hydrossis]|uniref:CHAT domain-containing protein n=1 Tax=Haliscomenobacter hydrossis (strain ATCC 27775 / DSM 1100 / LMG 10767 / O) TaxID=760192 RepID=F4L850_HALH1|nr:tetratricopeptide repeat protein [Haliscomenobacter hydrossis]AEE54558.1 hypothetical protein Halhy_6744 [Haliscomenobacter hydrossis DSM 1100]
MSQLPVILTAFANSYHADYLAHLEQEHDRLQQILAPLSYLRHVPLSSAKTGQLVSTLTQYQQELLIFHFGGHADGEQLRFRDAGGQVAGLVEQFGLHPQLKLLFLNGCNTQGQVRQYLETSIPAVIATTCSVQDGQARQFAELFYNALATGHTLQEAFTRAKGAMKLVDGAVQGEEIVNLRDARLRQEPETEVPWRLYVAGDEVLDWKLIHEKKSTQLLSLDHHRQAGPVIGRTDELKQLEALVQQANQNPIVIYGPSGIGKTLLAELFWEKHKGDFEVAAWINYRTSLVHTILEEIRPKNAAYVDLDEAPEKKLEWIARQYILHELQNPPGKKLLVLNNVPLGSDLPTHVEWLKISDLYLLITANEAIPQTTAYPLPKLSDAEIIELFKALTGKNANEAVQQLLAQLGQNALLTRIIAQNIPHDDLQEAKALITKLQKGLAADTQATSAEHNLLWALLHHAVTDPAQQWILLQFAAMPTTGFDADSFAELVLPEDGDLSLATGYQNYLEDHGLVGQETGLEDALESLVQGAWLEQKEDELWLPDAVREVVGQQYPKHSRYFKDLIESIRLSYFGEEYGPVKGNALFVSHLQSILPFLEYGEAYLTLHRLLIKTYNDLVYWYEEEKELKLLLDVVEKHEGQWSKQFWDICYNLSECCRRTGHIHDADHYSQIQLAVAQKIYANHPNLAGAQNERGLVLRDLGDYADTAQLLELALDSHLRNFGEDHPNVAVSQCNLALVYQDLGDYARAAQLLELALDSHLRNFGEDHPIVAKIQVNLANVLRDLGDYARAAQLLELALDSDMRNFGEDHPTVAESQSNLAKVLMALGNYARAVQLLELALASAMRNFGEDHPNVAVCQSNLAAVLISLGDYARAAQLFELALASAMRNFGEDHPNVAVYQSNLANVLSNLGDYARAAQLLELALASGLRNFGKEHPNVAECQSNLATVLSSLGNYARAAQLLELALASDLCNFGEEHPNVAIRQCNLASVYYQLDRLDEAKIFLEQALKTFEKSLGVNHPYYSGTVSSLKAVNEKLDATN